MIVVFGSPPTMIGLKFTVGGADAWLSFPARSFATFAPILTVTSPAPVIPLTKTVKTVPDPEMDF